MNIRVIYKEVLSTNGTHDLKGVVYLPEGEIKGYFQIVHGMTEYIGRYDKFMCDVASDGYIVFGYDHLGHGNTAVTEQELGFIAEKDGYKMLYEDVGAFYSAVKEEYGEMPYILMGHSMGSFVARLAAERSVTPDKLIIMGTGGRNNLAGLGIALAGLTCAFKGKRAYSSFLEKMAFGKYNARFRDENDKFSWISSDKRVRDKFRGDKFCNFRFTVSALKDLITLNKLANENEWFDEFNKYIKVLLVSGDNDPVGENGEKIKWIYEKLRNEGVQVTMKLYEGYRHEILNDSSYNKVLKDIKEFIK